MDINSLTPEQLQAIAATPLPEESAAAPGAVINAAPEGAQEALAGAQSVEPSTPLPGERTNADFGMHGPTAKVPQPVQDLATGGLAALNGFVQVTNRQAMSLRDATDALGYTDRAKTKAYMDQLQNTQNRLDAYARETGSQGAAAVGDTIGQLGTYGAEAAMIGAGSAVAVGKSLLGKLTSSGLAGGLPAYGAAGGEGDNMNNLINGATGAAIGVGSQAVASGLGAIGKSLFGNPVIDPERAAAFEAAGMKPTASQINQQVDDHTVRALQGLEADAKRIIGLGAASRSANQEIQFKNYAIKWSDEMDRLQNPGKGFREIANKLDTLGKHDLGFVKEAAKMNYDAVLNPVGGTSPDPAVIKSLMSVINADDLSFSALHQARHNMDDVIAHSLGPKSTATKLERNALYNTRGAISDKLAQIAKEQGISPQWEQVNLGYQDRLYAKIVQENTAAAFGGSAARSEGAQFNQKAFVKGFNKLREDAAKGLKIQPPKDFEKAIKNIGILGNTLTNSGASAGGKLGMLNSALGTAVGGVALGKVAYDAVDALKTQDLDDIAQVAVSTGILYGLGALLTTKTGVNMLAKMNAHSPKVAKTRLAITSALAANYATKHANERNGKLPFDMEAATPEQLNAIAQMPIPGEEESPDEGAE